MCLSMSGILRPCLTSIIVNVILIVSSVKIPTIIIVPIFWRELRDNSYINKDKTVWDEMSPVSVDHKVLEYLFESRGREAIAKENNKISVAPAKEIVVLDNKRSNFINIGMTKFPPPR